MAKILFIPKCREVLEQMKNRAVLTADGYYYRNSTLRAKESFLNSLEKYFKTLDSEVSFDDLNFNFTENYRMFLLQSNYAKNTIAEKMSGLRFWIRYFHKYELISYSGAGIRASMEITTAVITSVDELKYLYKMDLPPGQRKVIDIYICQCFLGLRISDMFRFLKQVKQMLKIIEEKHFFEIKTQKTGSVVVIPASKVVLQILQKYEYDFGDEFSEAYYNMTLKKIISKSKLERNVLFHRTEGGEKIERVKKFSDLISSHTARRTFASNAYLMGIDPLDVMKITGHKSYNSFFKYIRCENLAVALRVSTHEFFNIDFNA